MNNKTLSSLALVALLLPNLGSCVSTKSYRDVKSQLIGYQIYHDSLELQNKRMSDELARLRGDGQSDRTAELEDLLARREAQLFEINQTITDALSGFSGRGLSVTNRDGRIYVSMTEKLLFESGKAELSEDGEDAIARLSRVLADNDDFDIVVEGHTDDRGYIAKEGAQIVDNWDLSCKRATEVVRVMLRSSDLAPKRVIASGRSQYMPIAQGKSSSARAANRRTEIILTPQLDQLWEALGEYNQD